MSISFICSDAWTLRRELAEEIKAELSNNSGKEALIIVPEQITLETEQLALASAGLSGSFRFQVFSIRRFCSRILEKTGGSDHTFIDENGAVMLIRQAIEAVDKPLSCYERIRSKPAFAALAAESISAFREAGFSSEDVARTADRFAGTKLGDKLYDISRLYSVWEGLVGKRGTDEEALRAAAFAQLPGSGLCQGACVWFYGFDLMTRPLIQCAAALEKCSCAVRILATSENAAHSSRIYGPMEASMKRAFRLLSERGIAFIRTQIPCAERPLNDIRIFEGELFRTSIQPRHGIPAGIQLYAARNPRDEAEHAAAAIKSLVRDQNWRYRDIAIACQNPEAMYSTLRRVFRIYDIPVFFPESRSAVLHPLCASLLAALRCAAGPVRESDVQALLSLGYSGLEAAEASQMRNFARIHGVRGSRWLSAWHIKDDPEGTHAEFEDHREKCFGPVKKLSEGIKKGKTKDKLESVFTYLEETGAYARMLQETEALAECGEQIRASEGGQVWTKLISCLDQIELLFPDEAPDARMLLELIRQALSTAELKPLPQSADSVTAGSLEHMKGRPVKLLMILGATDSDETLTPSLLTDREREALSNDVWLGPDRQDRAYMRMLAVKNAVSFAEEEVRISWHVSTSDGSIRHPAGIVSSVRSVYPECPVYGGIQEDKTEEMQRMLEPEEALIKAGSILRREDAVTERDALSIHALSKTEKYRSRISMLSLALKGDEIPSAIDKNLANKLYNGPSRMSITRLENFAGCPFRHFVRYGVRCEEITEYGVTPRDSGTFCHEAISRFMAVCPEKMELEAAIAQMDSITSSLIKEYYPYITEDDTVSHNEIKELRSTARRSAGTILRHMGVSRFSPAAAEAAFKDCPDTVIDGTKLEGRIDRIDVWNDKENGGKKWICVIDYKRSGKEIDYSQLYYGLQLQLLIYLLAAGGLYDAEPAAALYFTVSDPLIKTRSTDPDEIAKDRNNELRLNGLMLNDEKTLRALSDPPSESLKVSMKNSGEPAKSTSLVTKDQLDLLIRNAIDKAHEYIFMIKSGAIAAAPALIGSYSPCDLCDNKAICRLDPYKTKAISRNLPKISAKEVFDLLSGKPTGLSET